MEWEHQAKTTSSNWRINKLCQLRHPPKPEEVTMRWFGFLFLCLGALTPLAYAEDAPILVGQVKAVGIAGASAVAQVGFFHPGGPIHDKPAFAALTAPGKILDKERVLVTSSSN